jgi:hypothetical protein
MDRNPDSPQDLQDAPTSTNRDRFRSEMPDMPADAPARGQRGIGTLLRDLSHEAATLVQQEVALAKAEMTEKVTTLARNAAYLAVGGLVAYAGLLVFLGALAWGLAMWMDSAGVRPGIYLWLAPLIVSIVVLLVGAALLTKGINTIKDANLAPRKTAQSLRETKDWVKEKIS